LSEKRSSNTSSIEATTLDGEIVIKSIACELMMSDVYDKVEFGEQVI